MDLVFDVSVEVVCVCSRGSPGLTVRSAAAVSGARRRTRKSSQLHLLRHCLSLKDKKIMTFIKMNTMSLHIFLFKLKILFLLCNASNSIKIKWHYFTVIILSQNNYVLILIFMSQNTPVHEGRHCCQKDLNIYKIFVLLTFFM